MNHLEKPPPATLFDDIPEEEVEKLCSQGRTETFDAGDRLFERGEEATELILLREGSVQLVFPVQIMGVSRDLTMETKQAGGVLAWSALIEPHVLTLSAQCISECEFAFWQREQLQNYFETFPSVGYLLMRNLAGVIGRRLQAMHDIWLRELQTSASQRLG